MENKELIGNLIGGTKPSQVRIIVNPNIIRSNPLQIGEYISIQYPTELVDTDVLGMINNLELVNLSIPESLMRSPESYERLKLLGNLESGEKLVATAKILGYYHNRKIIMPRYPPIPGAKVYRADKNILNPIFSEIGDIPVGVLRAHPDVEVKLKVNELIRRHTAILAITGAGKGNTVAVISEKILDLNGSVIIIDPHEEYPEMKTKYKDKICVFSPNDQSDKAYQKLNFKISNFSPTEIMDILEIQENATNQRALIYNVLEKLGGDNWDFKDFEKMMVEYLSLDGLNDEEKKNRKKEISRLESSEFVIKDRIKMIKGESILSKTDETPLYEEKFPSLVKKGQLTVISLSGLPLKIQQVIVARIANKIYNAGVAWRRGSGDSDFDRLPGPVFLIIEEAHNFIPQNYTPKSYFPIRRIAAEGRKFGVGLCIVSQRPGRVHSDVLSQCNSQIILKIVNPGDQSQILNSNESISEDLMSDLPSLNIGEAIITGPCIILPSLVKINEYKGKRGGDDIDILREWQTEKDESDTIYIETDEKGQNFDSEGKLIRGKKWS
jgi:hypothetical protein